MFIKAKERAGRTCFFLCITEQGGDAGRKAKVMEYSVCLGETLNLSKKQWLEILRGSKSFRLVPLEDVLLVVQEYVKKHGFRSKTADGLRDAAYGSGHRSGRGSSSGRKSQTDEYDAALDLLGLPPGSSDDEVESAFRKWARRHHPDVGGDPAKFRAIVAARRLLLGRVTYT
jgi:DnaJ domain